MQNCSAEAIEKTCLLHVHKLKPSTTTEEHLGDIKCTFPEAKVEKLNSMFPQLYSSFTVCINYDNLNKAWDDSIWPMGAHVTKFFLRKKDPHQPKYDVSNEYSETIQQTIAVLGQI
ncbi:hypothetical protein JTB14_015289 [Gonioctena quinquepunctata]|nr:hypothetical protein JTB14_015289 [Gonioctena quinquepunctata]